MFLRTQGSYIDFHVSYGSDNVIWMMTYLKTIKIIKGTFFLHS